MKEDAKSQAKLNTIVQENIDFFVSDEFTGTVWDLIRVYGAINNVQLGEKLSQFFPQFSSEVLADAVRIELARLHEEGKIKTETSNDIVTCYVLPESISDELKK